MITLKQVANFSNGIVLGVTIYFAIIWFLGVGLASLLTLSSIMPTKEHYVIGGVVGILTISLPLLLSTYFLQKVLLKTKFVGLK